MQYATPSVYGSSGNDAKLTDGIEKVPPSVLSYLLEDMAARINSYMLKLLGGDPEFHEPNSEPVPEPLVGKLMEGFKEVEGCVVQSSFPATSIWSETRIRTNNVDDETAFECTVSETHLEDFVDAGVPLSELARIACAYAMYLREALRDSPLSGTFRIIVDAQLPDADPER